MRKNTLFLLLLVSACAGPKLLNEKSGYLNGTWKPVSLEINGNPLPKAAFATQELVLKDSTYQFTAESVDKGIARYANGKMDLYGRDGVNKGKHFTCIYKYNTDTLTVCYNLAGSGYPEDFSTKGKPMYFLAVFAKTKE